jgi:ankyrin repeat protein
MTCLAIFLMGTAAGCDGDRARDDAERLPTAGGLVHAAERGDLSRVRRLLAAGADADERDESGRTPVTAAAMAERVEVVRALVDAGVDIDLQDQAGNNALLLCGENGNVRLLREVLRSNPDLRATNRFGGTALIPASDRGHVDMVRALLETDMPIDHVNRLGWTALLEAVVLGDGGPAHQQIVRFLVDAGADTAIPDRDGVTALEHARTRGYEVIARILERGRAAPR